MHIYPESLLKLIDVEPVPRCEPSIYQSYDRCLSRRVIVNCDTFIYLFILSFFLFSFFLSYLFFLFYSFFLSVFLSSFVRAFLFHSLSSKRTRDPNIGDDTKTVN